jgi:hypothetical protein
MHFTKAALGRVFASLDQLFFLTDGRFAAWFSVRLWFDQHGPAHRLVKRHLRFQFECSQSRIHPPQLWVICTPSSSLIVKFVFKH